MGELRIGTAGWNYPSGKGTWNGVFYPAARGRRGRGTFDELGFYAEHFDTVEVNSSFYGSPRPQVTRSWVERTPKHFEFSLKLYQKFTHPQMYKASHLRDVPGTAAELDALAKVNRADVDLFRAAIDPIAGAGKLGALLAQFPASFKNTAESRAYLEWLLKTFKGYPLAVELRHSTWSDSFGETVSLLNAFGAAWTQIDEPKFRFSIAQNRLPNVTSFYYMRLHGRNAKQWWHHAASEDRYNYLYSEEELKPFAETATAARALVKKAYLYMNNHFAAKSVANAAMLQHMTGEEVRGEYSNEFREQYPALEPILPKAAVPAPPKTSVRAKSRTLLEE